MCHTVQSESLKKRLRVRRGSDESDPGLRKSGFLQHLKESEDPSQMV